MAGTEQNTGRQHTEELQDIISAPPSWLLRWGIILFFTVLLLTFGLSAFIQYPDVVSASLTIRSAGKRIPVTGKSGKGIVKLLAQNNQHVIKGQNLAYLEGTESHAEVLKVLAKLKIMQTNILSGKQYLDTTLTPFMPAAVLQNPYRTFYRSYLHYQDILPGGFYAKKLALLQDELAVIQTKEQLLNSQQTSADRIPAAMKQEYIRARIDHSEKQREILETEHRIRDEQISFTTALNTMISELENWKSIYVSGAAASGRLISSQSAGSSESVYYIDPDGDHFTGEMLIRQQDLEKVKEGQKVLIKLKGFPYQEYGILQGKISYIADAPASNNLFPVRVSFHKGTGLKKNVTLKNGLPADADILTQNMTLLKRILNNITKNINGLN